jgi:integrase
VANTRGRRARHTGGIYQRPDGRWSAQLDLGRDETGRRQRVTVSGPTRAAVAEKLNELVYKRRHGTLPKRDDVTLARYAQAWLDRKARELRPATLASYQRLLKVHVLPAVGGVKLQAVRPAHIHDFLDQLAKGKLSSRTQRYCAWLLSTILHSALERELIARNPAAAARVKAPPPERRVKAWSRAEVAAFLAAADGDRLAPAFLLALITGLRRGELLGLRWQDLDLDAGTLQVEQTAGVVGSQMILSKPKTAGSRRRLYIGPAVTETLRAHQARQEAEARAASEWEGQDLVFTTGTGGLIHARNFARSLTRIAKRAGVPDIGPHGLRHTYTSLARERGTQLEVVSKTLGHADPGFTLRVYRHVFESERQAAALDITDLLATPGPRAKA